MLRPEVTCGQKAIEFVDRLQELIGWVDSRRELPLPSCVLHSLQRARDWFRVGMQGEFPVAAMIGNGSRFIFWPEPAPGGVSRTFGKEIGRIGRSLSNKILDPQAIGPRQSLKAVEDLTR